MISQMLPVSQVKAANFTVEIISPATPGEVAASSMSFTAPAYDLAVHELRRDYSEDFQIRLTYLVNSSVVKSCDDAIANVDGMLAQYYYSRTTVSNLTVLAFPGCAKEGVSVARIAAGLNHLVMLGSYADIVFRDRELYPNVIQASAVMARPIISSISSFLAEYSWRTVYFVADTVGVSGFFAIVGSSTVASHLRAGKCTVYLDLVDSSLVAANPFVSLLNKIRKVARIVNFWGHALSLRKFMVYLFLDVYEYPTWLYGNATWQNFDKDDEDAFSAYQALFVISPTPTVTAHHAISTRERILQELVRRAKHDYGYSYLKNETPTPTVLSNYATLKILGEVLRPLLRDNSTSGSIDTAVLVRNIIDHTFNTTAGTFSFDSAGERIIPFDVKQLNTTTGGFDTVLRQNPKNLLRFLTVRQVIWRGGEPPLDEPICGFSGQIGPCADKGTDVALIAGVTVFGLGVIITAIIYYVLRDLARGIGRDVLFSSFDITSDLMMRRDSGRSLTMHNMIPRKSAIGFMLY
ncbi:hypothetical protein BV898_08376 [Hypsibius exemplaris]|uniref:Receptor ligand binding region domain-containing protein n=1 Tax=Hypsibius exemplaris TaxID=2072580 RepID=A0A1W0WQF8_HYPEX|nr:hypothetical protein BV898_08376 [Hypsibius exemplaris]